jgi:hydrogenase maturation protein HypF
MTSTATATVERLHIELAGAVQGVGFRPRVYRLAGQLRLAGWVRNSSAGIEIEVEGDAEQLDAFLRRLEAERPAAALVATQNILRVAPSGGIAFEILPSVIGSGGECRTAGVLPDLATCAECVREIFDPANRRFGYAFTNCTNCGPRFTIQRDIPYDRPHTAMRGFKMCSACQREYDSFEDRRFHAQPIACSVCGPQLRLWPAPATTVDPIAEAASALAHGKIVALKGVGGFQLLVDARDAAAVSRLRSRKHRDAKPFALLMPSLECVRRYCLVNPAEEELLLSRAAPIVLLQPVSQHDLAAEVVEGAPCLGVMLACSPLHHLLMALYPHPVIATSGNRSGEPIAIDNDKAIEQLSDIADLFVLHDRSIVRPCDDSVVRMLYGQQIVRRSRGYAPLPVTVPFELRPVLAVGGHLKNTVAIAIGRQVYLSQHIGDLDSLESRQTFAQAIEDLCKLHRFQPELIVSDLHPDYASTQWAMERSRSLGVPLVQVQHHHAHVAGCAAENGVDSDYLGVAWDGAGLGLDGTIWGGEFFLAGRGGLKRIAHLRPFPLPGSEAAMHDCSRPAAGLLWSLQALDNAPTAIEPSILALLDRGLQSPRTSSVGRLFDAVAYLSAAATHNRFEGQAAMSLQAAIGSTVSEDAYELPCANGIGDWSSLIEQVVFDQRNHLDAGYISVRFHNALANWIAEVARTTPVRDVVLSGGVFQNAYLTRRSTLLLEGDGFRVHTHHQTPANDGGLALGQAVVAGRIVH